MDGVIAIKPKHTYYVCEYDCGSNQNFIAITDDSDAAYDAYYAQVVPNGGAVIVNGTVRHHSDVNSHCSVNLSCGTFNQMWCLGAYYQLLNQTTITSSAAHTA